MLFFLESINNEADKEKVVLLYNSYHQPLYYLAYSRTKDSAAAEDLVQETYVTLMKHLESVDEETYQQLDLYIKQQEKNPNLQITDFAVEQDKMICLKTWNFLATILKNKITDWYRSNKKAMDFTAEKSREEDAFLDANHVEAEYIERERISIIKEVIFEMKSPYKEVLTLKYYNNFSTEKIGVILGKTPENVRQLLTRGRKKLKKDLEKRGIY